MRFMLEELGARVSDIPRTSRKTPDFLVTLGECRMIVEEKEKLDADDWIEEKENTLARGEIHRTSTSIAPNNRLSGITREAADQLRSASGMEHDFRIVWFTATNFDAEARHKQFIATLYGTVGIVEMDKPHRVDCYFFHSSAFHRHKDFIDGAVAAYVPGSRAHARFCLNPLSSKYNPLQSSTFVQCFGTAVTDPIKLEKDGEAFVADTDIDREDEAGLLEYLRRKYAARPLMTFDVGSLVATVRVSG